MRRLPRVTDWEWGQRARPFLSPSESRYLLEGLVICILNKAGLVLHTCNLSTQELTGAGAAEGPAKVQAPVLLPSLSESQCCYVYLRGCVVNTSYDEVASAD